jgi:hypothetical protein
MKRGIGSVVSGLVFGLLANGFLDASTGMSVTDRYIAVGAAAALGCGVAWLASKPK